MKNFLLIIGLCLISYALFIEGIDFNMLIPKHGEVSLIFLWFGLILTTGILEKVTVPQGIVFMCAAYCTCVLSHEIIVDMKLVGSRFKLMMGMLFIMWSLFYKKSEKKNRKGEC